MAALLRLGTRGSQLALRQADLVREALLAQHPGLTVELEIITTHGDRAADVPLQRMSGQGVFARAIEEALLDGRIDVAVHSLKDLPSVETPGLEIAAVPPREDARDALVSRGDLSFAALPAGARVATGSPRRAAQLKAARPDLQIVDIRGNLDTRLRKLETDGLDAMVLAVAGLSRLGLAGRIAEALPTTLCLPAVGQGALAVQCRADDAPARALVTPLDDAVSRAAVQAERALLAALGGGCKVPIAAHATLVEGELRLDGVVAAPDGSQLLRDSLAAPVAAAALLGMGLAARLMAAGAGDLLGERATPGTDSDAH
ncbi:MAG TPA: hydroxymethylbilane synthase [Chloroflexota bacterium]|nr:hydroxymethylbilane synthase [Chloroflexota bacterium]